MAKYVKTEEGYKKISDISSVSSDTNVLILNSSTEGSKKRFKITIDDDGTLIITEDVNIDNLVHTDVTNLSVSAWIMNQPSTQYYPCTYGKNLKITDGVLSVDEVLTANAVISVDNLANTLRGNYLVKDSAIYYVPTDAKFTISSSTTNYITTNTLKVDYVQQLTLS